ncbi:MAG: outer membrane protein assembly factor BamA [Nitrospiria bacterium]
MRLKTGGMVAPLRKSCTLVSVFLLVLIYFYSAGQAQENEIRIKLIEVKGNLRIDRMTILSRLTLKEGDLFSPERIRSDIQQLYRMGLFENITVESEGLEGGLALYFLVQERPFLVDVVYEGNDNIDADQFDEETIIKKQSFLNPDAIDRYVLKIKETYEAEAYYNTSVIPVTQRLPNNQAVLTFLITEGDQAYIRNIAFDGNKAFDEKRLKKEMETSSYFWLTSWITESGRYKKEQLAFDRERVKELYMNNGYFDVEIDSPKVALSEDKAWFDIRIPIVEGAVFTFGEVAIEGGTLFNSDEIAGLAKSKSGTTFNRGLIRQDIARMVDYFGERGHIYANVVPNLNPNPADRTVDIGFHITEGTPVQVREIHISGNTKTRDKVIRREIRVNEREKINTKALRRSFQRLHNLNYFETVNIVPNPIESGWVDLDVEVKEKPTGTFSIGGGYSSEDRFVATVDITMGNFLGKGQLLKLKAETGRRRDTYSLTFREPYLMDRNISGTVNLFNQVRDFGSYEEKRTGGDLIVGKAFGEFTRGSASYTLETLEVFNLDTLTDPVTGLSVIDPIVPRLVKEQSAFGETLTSSIGLSLSRDTRDFQFDPKEGGRNALSFEYAGTFLGGDNAYYKVVLDSSRFFPLWWNHIFSMHGRFGFAEGIDGKPLPVGERFFVGGINTVRGFKFGKAGPVDPPVVGEILGGNKELYFNFEYLVPIVTEAQLKLLLFYDYGAAFNDGEAIKFSGMRKAAGFGIRWISPVGPLRLEWGYNLDPRPGEPQNTTEFSIGSLF